MSIKNFLLSLGMMIIMSVPTLAGTVEIQTSVPVYTVKEGQTLTEEEQKVIDNTIIYFINNPTVKEVVLSTKDYPNLSANWYNELFITKVDLFCSDYTLPIGDGREINNNSHISWAYRTRRTNGEELVYIKNKLLDQYIPGAWTLYDLYGWIGYTYHLVPQLGIYNGMDEWQAVDIFNNWICDYLTFSDEIGVDYLSIYETHAGKCADYAALFKTLCKGAGIECARVNNTIHAWNQVVIDGQEYEIDVLWNDGNDRYKYYMISQSVMAQYPSHENWSVKY